METTILTELAAIRAEHKSILKLLRKIRSTQEDPTGEKAAEKAKNNGFNRATEITPELRAFLELEPDEKISRSAVMKRIHAYISSNNLQHPDNGRIIILDNKLTELIQPPDGVEVTYLNLQTHLSKHYIKPPPKEKAPRKKKEPAAAPAEPAPVTEEPVAEEPAPKKKVVRKAKA